MSDGQFKVLLSFQCRMVVACECNWHDFLDISIVLVFFEWIVK